jgi:hypothetical protein
MIRCIGDAHGKIDRYIAMIQGIEKSVLLGDVGMGFHGVELPISPPGNRFIRGNHDDPSVCKKHPNFVPDGTYENGIMYIGGAWSIDYEWRQRYENGTGVRIWWSDEEVSYEQGFHCIQHYETHHPQIMLTHDCPTEAAHQINSNHTWDTSRTRSMFDSMLMMHRPKLWVFAHHHVDMNFVIDGTTFICLDELSHIDIQEENFLEE